MILADASHSNTAVSLVLLMTVAAGGLALGNVQLRGVLFEIDGRGRCVAVERVRRDVTGPVVSEDA